MLSRLRHSLGTRALAAGALVCLAVGFGVNAFAPQALVLARTAFPPETWTGEGKFALVAGVTPQDRPSGADAPEPVLARFTNSGGRALLVDRSAELVIETYGPETDRDTLLNSFSLVKSLVGALALRAVADGRIESMNVSLQDLLGSDAPDVSLDAALRMRSGLMHSGEPAKPVEDSGFSPFSPLAELHVFGLDQILPDLGVDPELEGTFLYQSANTALIGAAVETAYQRPLPQLLSEMVWAPAGAANAHWSMHSEVDEVTAYCCLFARPIDWLKVGRFLLNNGHPNAPFLPEQMWQDLFLPKLPSGDRRAGVYGWHLRHDVLDRPGASASGPFAYFLGHLGQVVYLLPEQDTVVVRFGREMQLLHSTLYEVLDDS